MKPSDETPFVSVIVPVWNGANDIGKCLDALAGQTYPRERFEVLVVDNGSTDGTSAIVAAYPGISLLSEPVASSYRARNRGLAHARGEYALFTDADCVPEPDWISAAVRAALANPAAGILGGRIRLLPVEEGDAACETLEELFSFNQERTLAAGYCVTANWMSPTALLRELNGFDPELKSGGDVELSHRIARSGRFLVYVPEMTVGHPIRGSYAEMRGKYLRTLGGRWTFHRGKALRVPRILAGQTISTWRRIKTTLAAPGVPRGRRLRAAWLLVRLHLEGLVETARLICGGNPRRS